MTTAYVGIGSNIDPAANVRDAVHLLRSEFPGLRESRVYRSPAYGFDGDEFLNLVVGFETGLDADAVEDRLAAIEYSGGRVRTGIRFGPRTLDLDLLIFGQAVNALQRLPRMDVLAYPFVLLPLAELAPDLPHPLTGVPLAAAARMLDSGQLTCIGSVAALEDAGAG